MAKNFNRAVEESPATQQTEAIEKKGMEQVDKQKELASVPSSEKKEWELESKIGCSGKLPMSIYARTQAYRIQHKLSLTSQISIALDYWLSQQGF